MIEPGQDGGFHELFIAVARFEGKLDSIVERIGSEGVDGGSGTGIIGQLLKLERRIEPFERMKERITGAFLAISVVSVGVWWFVRAKIAALFGVGQGG